MPDRILRSSRGGEPRRQDDLAHELEPGRTRRREQLVPIQHPAEVLGPVAVPLRALEHDERRRGERGWHPCDVEEAAGRTGEPGQRRAASPARTGSSSRPRRGRSCARGSCRRRRTSRREATRGRGRRAAGRRASGNPARLPAREPARAAIVARPAAPVEERHARLAPRCASERIAEGDTICCASRSSRGTGCPSGISWFTPSGPGPSTRKDGHFSRYTRAIASTFQSPAVGAQPSGTYSHSGSGERAPAEEAAPATRNRPRTSLHDRPLERSPQTVSQVREQASRARRAARVRPFRERRDDSVHLRICQFGGRAAGSAPPQRGARSRRGRAARAGRSRGAGGRRAGSGRDVSTPRSASRRCAAIPVPDRTTERW